MLTQLTDDEVIARWTAARSAAPDPEVMAGDPGVVVGWNVRLRVTRAVIWDDRALLERIYRAASVAGCVAALYTPVALEFRGQFAAAPGTPEWDLPAVMKAHELLAGILREVGAVDGTRVGYLPAAVTPVTVRDVRELQEEGQLVRFIPC